MLFKIIFVALVFILIRNIMKGISTVNKMKEAVERKKSNSSDNSNDIIDAEFKVVKDD